MLPLRQSNRYILFILIVIFSTIPAFLTAENLPPAGPAADYVENEVIVLFSDSCSEERAAALCDSLGDLRIKDKIAGKNIYLAETTPGRALANVCADLSASPEIICAEPNYLRRACRVPDDTFYGAVSLYAFNIISAPTAWDTIVDADIIVVAVFDSGLDYEHPDLTDNIWNNDNDPIDGIDNDANGYIDDFYGWNFVDDNNNPTQLDAVGASHGTFCAGIIGARGNNAGGITGVCWQVKIMPVAIANSAGVATSFNFIDGLTYAVNNGAKVVNFSFIGTSANSLEQSAISDAHDAGVLLITAAGNTSADIDVIPGYPASYDCDNIIAVAATDSNDDLSSFSSYGENTVDIAAPGTLVGSTIYATARNNIDNAINYGTASGTSFSTPYVAGSCALVWANDANLNHMDVKEKILGGADSISSLSGFVNGARRLNVNGALAYDTDDDTDPGTDDGVSHSTRVEALAGARVIVERAMYWDGGAFNWIGGHNSTGTRSTATTWYLAEGYTGGSFDEWVLLQNPGNNSAECQVTFMKPDGSTVLQNITIDPTSRYTIHANAAVPNESISTKVESTNGIGIIVERAMYWDAGGIDWAGGHSAIGTTDTATTWYLAEGYSVGNFDTYVLIQNPSSSNAQCLVTFMKPDGSTVALTVTVAATGRYTIYANSYVPNESFSTRVVSLNGVGVIVERAMYWDAGGMNWIGGHSAIAANDTATTWYLAEGYTGGSFDTYVLIQNPSSTSAECQVTFMKPDGSTVSQELTVAGTSRQTIHVNSAVPDESVSTTVESTNSVEIIVERAMYWDANGVNWIGGHSSMGTTATATTWYLAEGYTGGTFDEYVLIQNPNASSASIKVTFMKTNGNNVVENITLSGSSRHTIHANDVSGL